MTTSSHSDFTRRVLAEFPEIRPEIEDSDGLLHIEIGVLAEHAQSAKGRADWSTYERCMRLIDELFVSPDPQLENAIYVSFLEYLDFNGKRGAKAWSLLSPRLQAGWHRVMEHLKKLGEQARSRGSENHR